MTIRRAIYLGFLCAVVIKLACAQESNQPSSVNVTAPLQSPTGSTRSTSAEDVRHEPVPWSELADVPTRKVQNKLRPRFRVRQLKLHHKVQRFRGYMIALSPDTLQHRFLLQPTPGCDDCNESDVEQTIEVTGRAAMPYTSEPITVEGAFSLVHDHPNGLFYRLENAVRLD